MLDDTRRRLLFGAIAGAAAVPMIEGVAAAQGRPSEPRQGWASKDGAIKLRTPATVQATADPMAYLLIHEAFARYGIAHDEVAIPVLTALFTDDAVLEVAKGNGKPFQTVRGGKAIVANFANVLSQQRDQRRHCFSNIVIERLSGDAADAIAYGLVSVAADGLILGATVVYNASLRRVGGHWRFSRLFIGMDDYTTPPPKV
jgi:ketosteroid isomerase-like protein